jgi:hypothetical protein
MFDEEFYIALETRSFIDQETMHLDSPDVDYINMLLSHKSLPPLDHNEVRYFINPEQYEIESDLERTPILAGRIIILNSDSIEYEALLESMKLNKELPSGLRNIKSLTIDFGIDGNVLDTKLYKR